MSAVTTLVATVAVAAGAVALFRLAEKRTRPLRSAIDEMRRTARDGSPGAVIDYEQDPDSGVFKPKESAKH